MTTQQRFVCRQSLLFNMAAVDVEDESILASIFKDSFPDSWRDNPDFAAYLSELSSFGVEKLTREPERLAEERAQILQQTRELAFSNYQTFIRTADCTELIYRDFGRVESSVSRLLDKLPGFGERCRSVLVIGQLPVLFPSSSSCSKSCPPRKGENPPRNVLFFYYYYYYY